jgi:hypothetical protein
MPLLRVPNEQLVNTTVDRIKAMHRLHIIDLVKGNTVVKKEVANYYSFSKCVQPFTNRDIRRVLLDETAPASIEPPY